MKCGDGDQADVKRFQLALLSNVGRRDMTKTERQKIVAVLAGPDHDWTQTSIAKALGVSREAIKKDIAELEASGSLVRSTKPNRPKGGRPPKEPKKPVTCERTKKTAPSHTSWGPHSSSFRGAG